MAILRDGEAIQYPAVEARQSAVAYVSSSATPPTHRGVEPKRILDFVGAALALILCAPVMIFVYLMLGASGSVIFVQRRVGRDGRLFGCYKFRSMVHDAEKVLAEHLRRNPAARDEWERNFKLVDDPRITRFGRWLRRTSVDELPQLFNVLRGEMSLVGPRPIVQEEIGLYGNKIRAYYSCRPGLTGLWQIHGRNLVAYERRVVLDAIYARRQSMKLDVIILLKTVGVVLSGRGAF